MVEDPSRLPSLTPQLLLPFPDRRRRWPDLTTDPSVGAAVQLLQNYAHWPTRVAAITGPMRSGVSTLLLAWSEFVDGAFLRVAAFEDLPIDAYPAMLCAPVAIDDADHCKDGTKLLTLLNLAREAGQSVILGGHSQPSEWSLRPLDLQSRLNAIQQASIPEPDEAIIAARLRIIGQERFLHLGDETIQYLLKRIEWSYADIVAVTDLLEKKAEELGRSPSIPLARYVVETLYPDNALDD